MAGAMAVIGAGNILMGDDGVGVAVVEAIRRAGAPEHVELYDAGTALQDVLPHVDRCERVVLVDCCRAGGAPGTVYRAVYSPEGWDGGPMGDSLHDLNAVQALRMHELARGALGEVILIGVEPADVSLRMGLSPELEERLPAIVSKVMDELQAPSRARRGGTE